MGIFTNPSDVPEPGPPPKKETVRVELSGCGFLVKYHCHCNVFLFNIYPFIYYLHFLSSVVRWSDLLFCHVLNVMPVSGPMCQLQQKPLVFLEAVSFLFYPFLGWVWFTLCYCCCLGYSLLPFCVNDFKVL